MLCVRRSVRQGRGPGRCRECKGQAKRSPKHAKYVAPTGNADKRKAAFKQLAEPGGKIYSHSVLFSYHEAWATAKTFRK